MIHISFSSIIMTVFMSNVLLIILSLCFYNKHLLGTIGYKLLAVFCIVTLVRFLLPYEFPFTKTIAFPTKISYLVSVLTHPYSRIFGIRLSIWTGLCAIWILGIIVSIVHFMHERNILQSNFKKNSIDITDEEPLASILAELCTEKQRKKLRVLKVNYLPSPLLMGLRHPAILLPESFVTSEMQTRSALQHEIFHYTHHDLWLKFAVNCLVSAYWWNPFSHILNHQVDELLEMRVDAAILNSDDDTAEAYVTTFKCQLTGEDAPDKCSSQISSFMHLEKGALNRRILMMQNLNKQPNYVLNVVLLIVIFSVYILSYLYIFEGHYYPQEVEDTYITTNDSNCYAIINSDGLFDIYFSDGISLKLQTRLNTIPQI